MSILFGILTAIGFGAGDFWGGLASQKTSPINVSLYSQITAAILIGTIALFLGGIPEPAGLIWGTAAGLAVGIGIVRYYRALSNGEMGLTATVMGVFSALVPFFAGLIIGERPSVPAILGVATVVAALVLVTHQSSPDESRKEEKSTFSKNPVLIRLTGLSDAFISGTCFGFSFVFVGLGTTTNPLWPVFATAAGSLLPILMVFFWDGNRLPSPGSSWKVIAAAGVAQGGGFIAFGLAVMDGLISIVSVAGALSPIPTAIIALMVLGERVTAKQITGIAIALAGIVCLVLG